MDALLRRTLARRNRDLLVAFESARTRLAVLIALERKSSTMEDRRRYDETSEGVRRFTRRLRKAEFDALAKQYESIHALQVLTGASLPSEAAPFCRMLDELLCQLE